MSVNARVAAYLDDHKIKYDVVPHEHSFSSFGTAINAQVSPWKLAKGVLLEDHEGRYMMAVLPSDNRISLHKLGESLNWDFHLASEKKVYHIFSDCAPGAIPPVANAFHMETIVDERLDEQRDVFMEAGDHENLIHFNHYEFQKLTHNNQHGRFSGQVIDY